MKHVLTIAVGLLASLQLMAGSACCPVKAQSAAKEDAKPTIATVKTMEAATKDKSCEGKECAGKSCDKADMKACTDNMKKLGAAWQAMKANNDGVIGTSALKQVLTHNQNIVILDARTNKYDDGKRIPGAQLVGPSPSDKEIAAIVPNKDAYIVTYCGSLKCPLGGKLADKLRDLGYKNVVEYSEGIGGWIADGNQIAAVVTN